MDKNNKEFEKQQLDNAVDSIMKFIRESNTDLAQFYQRIKKANDQLEEKIKKSRKAV